MRRFLPVSVLTALAMATLPAEVRAQDLYALLFGKVIDRSGGGVPDAIIEITASELPAPLTTRTIADGRYGLPGLLPGAYRMVVKCAGFQEQEIQGVELRGGESRRLDVRLALTHVTEWVDVFARASDRGSSGGGGLTVIPREQIERVPKGRDFTSLVAPAVPGAIVDPQAGGLLIEGTPDAEHRFVVNGMDATHPYSGSSGKEVLVDFLEQVRIRSNEFAAEHRIGTGALISAVTKSGSDIWHGSLGLYGTTRAWLGEGRPTLQLDPLDESLAQYVLPPEDAWQTLEPLGDIGGPLRRGWLWGYGAYSLRRTSRSRDVNFAISGERAAFDSVTAEHNLYTSLTLQRGSRLRARFSTINERDRGGVALPVVENDGLSYSNPELFPSRAHDDYESDLYSASVDATFTPSWQLSLSGGYFTSGRGTKNAYTGYRRFFATSNTGFPEILPELRFVAGYADAPENRVTLWDDYSRSSFAASSSHMVSWHGSHLVKAGLQVDRIYNNVDAGDQSPNVSLFWDRALYGVHRGRYGVYSVRQSQTKGEAGDTSVGVFVQDAWTLSNRVTLEIGVRADREELPSFRPANPGIVFGFGDKVAPRVRVAWDVAGDGRWKISGGWGRFFDLTNLFIPREAFGASYHVTSYLTLDTFDWPAINCQNPAVSGLDCPGTLIDEIDFRVPWNADSSGQGGGEVEPGLRPYGTHEWAIGLDDEISSALSVGVRYVRRRVDEALEDLLFRIPERGEVYRIVNPGRGSARYPQGEDHPPLPAPSRRYDGLEISVRKRFARSWAVDASYVFSGLRGNYSGLVSADEDGRVAPGMTATFDELASMYDASRRPIDGPLPTDRTHVAKAQGTVVMPWGTMVGANFLLASGTPLQRELWLADVFTPVLYRNRLSDGRTPVQSQTDLLLRHDVRLGQSQRVGIELTVLNLFDQKAVTDYFMSPYYDFFPATGDEHIAGWDPDAVAADTGLLPDPRFGLASAFQDRRRVQFSVKYTF